MDVYDSGGLANHEAGHIFYRLARPPPPQMVSMWSLEANTGGQRRIACQLCGRTVYGYCFDCPTCLLKRCMLCEQLRPCGHPVMKILLKTETSQLATTTPSSVPTAQPVAGLAGTSAHLGSMVAAVSEKVWNGLPQDGKNRVISPLSICMAMAMVSFATCDKVQQEVNAFLGLPNLASFDRAGMVALIRALKASPLLHMANGIFFAGLSPAHTFVNLARDTFDAVCAEADANRINAWVAAATQGLITDVVKQTVDLALVNVLYFKGRWQHPFDPQISRQGTFKTFDGGELPVRMMTQTREFQYFADAAMQAVALPFAGGDVVGIVVLPGRYDVPLPTLEQVVANFNRPRKLELHLPSFRVSADLELRGLLTQLGLVAMFEVSSDFQPITGLASFPVKVDAVVHKVVLQVDEAGAEAAAVTAVLMSFGGRPAPPPRMVCDRPFHFFIYDTRHGICLFRSLITMRD